MDELIYFLSSVPENRSVRYAIITCHNVYGSCVRVWFEAHKMHESSGEWLE